MTKLLGNHKVQKQVDALLSVMTLEQKIGQMTQPDRMTCSPQQANQHHIGSILSSSGSSPKHNRPADWVAMNDAYWQASTAQDQNHLPIPLLYGLDAIHGNNNVRGATIFPHNIGLGAAHDSQLLKQIAKITALEVLASGVDWVFAPNLAVAADQHWGRTYESYSSDPRLVTRYAGQIIQGLQGKFGAHNVLACAKHWVGEGGTQYGVDQGDTLLSWQQLQDQHIAPYFEALKAGALSIMVSFSSWNGDKCHANKFLLIDTLKQQMNFQGMLVSDMQGIDYLADDFYLAVAHGVNAGIDMFMGPQNWQQFIEYLSSHVELGTVPIERINDAVRRILSVKFAIGLFDKGRPSERKWSDHSSFGSLSHRRVARRAVRKSLVLLKNSHSLLPLKKHSNILVAGKNAHNLGHQCGGFTIAWQGVRGNQAIAGGTSIWQGIKNTAINAQLSHDGTGVEADPQLHDVAIVVIGETPYAEGAGDIRQHDHIITQAGAQINGQVKVIQAYGHSP
jgi:beta-glucosidase